MSRALLKELPVLEREGLISPEQAERIRTRYADNGQSANRMLVFFAVLGSLLVGLGIILIVAHNWNDLTRGVRTALAIVPVLIAQGLVGYTLLRQPASMAWREGSAVLLACALCACIALVSQIYHISGDLAGYLLTCSLLMLPLLYLLGSTVTSLVYLSMVTWYAWAIRFEHWSNPDVPWMALLLLLAAVPYYVLQARERGTSTGFWWLSLFMALAVGICSQFCFTDWEVEQALCVMGFAGMFTLVPWLHPGRELRTWPWVLIGAITTLVVFCTFSFRGVWEELDKGPDHERKDTIAILGVVVVSCAVYLLSLARRRPFERWPWPEGLGLMLICYGLGRFSPGIAAVLINLALLVMGVMNVKLGIEQNSLPRMNLGLAILGLAILLRFFDSNLSFVVRGLAFVAIGTGFLFMNMRMVRQRRNHEG